MLEDQFTIAEQSPSERAVITSALNLFIIHHENTINVAQLMKAVGVSKATFYKYFANKEDVYAAILLTDEMALTSMLKDLRVYGTVSDLLEQYLKFRIQHVEKYRVLVRLEKYLLEKKCELPRFTQWQLLRRQHVDEFSSIVESKLSRMKPIDKENVRFYYGLVWSIANGVANLSESDFFHELILDRRGFTRFLLESVSSIGEGK
ncbi:TetR/AcrR family transcriptional regulator [Reinekea sp. G2M2-21]|uniref:TetR/AcrR family transcriptional regulator n=1 Tax=Reinekea sp. G2M2-21 TaxID=2788942 RepID=UPI0018AA52AE|nr:TetR/AcrR family transcriptional regulator [Reinekea sp. G2M2-21]